MENKDLENRLLKDLKYLKRKYREAPFSMKERYAEAIRELAYLMAPDPFNRSLSYKKELQMDYLELLKYSKEFDYARQLCFFQNYIDPLPIKTTCFFTKEELLEITHDFYKTTNKVIYENFIKDYKNYNTNFIYKSKIDINDATGATFRVPLLQKSYIIVKREKSILPIMTSIHEYGHAINNQINTSRSFFNAAFLDELYPLFFELIAIDYLNDIMDTPNINRYNAVRAYTYITNACLLNDVNNLALSNTKKNLSDINQIIKKTKGIKNNSNNIKKYIKNSNTVVDLQYSLSYMIAVELYKIYQKDKECALELLRRIGAKSYDQIKEAEKYLNIGSSLPKYLAKVKKENC